MRWLFLCLSVFVAVLIAFKEVTTYGVTNLFFLIVLPLVFIGCGISFFRSYSQ